MKKYLPYLVILILVILLVWKWNNPKTHYNPSEIKTETIFSQKPWVPEKPFEIIQNPNTLIWFYGIKDSSKVKPYQEVKIEKDTIVLYNDEFSNFGISKDYLLIYPNNDKLISFDLCKSELKLNLLNVKGKVFQKSYQVDLNSYQYRYTENNLSVKELPTFKSGKSKLSLKPNLEYQFRPINNFHDLTLSLKLNTTRFNYELGINTSYYPSLSKKVNKDLIFGLSYNF